FEYGGLRLDADAIRADGHLRVQVDVANAGSRAGDEVVQLYVRRERGSTADTLQELRGFQRVHLAPGERRTVAFTLEAPQALRHYDDARAAYVVRPGAYEVRVGASSADVRAQGRFTVVPTHD
ncbi:glucan 1,4-alpha-glucosidase, partial [Mesorhizobium sp. M1C.F.Ca.ET.212.01.1.1]